MATIVTGEKARTAIVNELGCYAGDVGSLLFWFDWFVSDWAGAERPDAAGHFSIREIIKVVDVVVEFFGGIPDVDHHVFAGFHKPDPKFVLVAG